jgi:hypothetical protein
MFLSLGVSGCVSFWHLSYLTAYSLVCARVSISTRKGSFTTTTLPGVDFDGELQFQLTSCKPERTVRVGTLVKVLDARRKVAHDILGWTLQVVLPAIRQNFCDDSEWSSINHKLFSLQSNDVKAERIDPWSAHIGEVTDSWRTDDRCVPTLKSRQQFVCGFGPKQLRLRFFKNILSGGLHQR